MKLTTIHKDIESIEFKVLSEKSIFHVASLDESIEALSENFSPEYKYITNFTVDVYAVDGMGEILAVIGFLKGSSIEAEVTFADVNSFLELCDMVSTDLYLMAEAITDKDGHVKKSICPPERNIMYIENMYVEEIYRGMGIGKYLLDNISGLFSQAFNYSHHAFLLKPFPQIKCGEHSLRDLESVIPEEIEKLVDFYKRAGYQFIKGSDYMYKIQSDELFQMLGI